MYVTLHTPIIKSRMWGLGQTLHIGELTLLEFSFKDMASLFLFDV